MPSGIDPTKHLGLIAKIANMYTRYGGEPYEDLFQVGYLGLHRAAIDFDPSKNCKFSSFAIPHIRGEILHYLRDKVPMIKNARNKPLIPVVSLDAPVLIDSNTTLMDTIESVELNLGGDDYTELWASIDQLEEKERTAIVLHYLKGLKYKDVASKMNISPQTVARRIKRGNLKLRESISRARNTQVQAK